LSAGGRVPDYFVVRVNPVVMNIVDIKGVERSIEFRIQYEEGTIIDVVYVWDLSSIGGGPFGGTILPSTAKSVVDSPWVSNMDQVGYESSIGSSDLICSQNVISMRSNKIVL